ncbi:MAG TPA: NAD(P)H-binding protein [Acidimicrobiia bacterium]|nr:NAD(P)H-binding protein [Acidimicrobiia bacterium]
MPLLVVGADHTVGEAIVRQTVAPDREVRAFVTDPARANELKALGAKVATGDLSDEGHIAAAATRCFAIAFVLDAIGDGRELSFAEQKAVPALWAAAAKASGVRRVIWVGAEGPDLNGVEVASVDVGDRDPSEVAAEVAAIEDRPVL